MFERQSGMAAKGGEEDDECLKHRPVIEAEFPTPVSSRQHSIPPSPDTKPAIARDLASTCPSGGYSRLSSCAEVEVLCVCVCVWR